MPKNTLVVPTDFSAPAALGVEYAARLAQAMSGTLVLTHVTESGNFWKFGVGNDALAEARQKAEEKLREEAHRISQAFGVHVQTELGQGKVYAEVARVAREKNAAFIIMGTNGEDTLAQRFIGSNTYRVIREIEIPVISVQDKLPETTCRRLALPLDLTKETRQKVSFAIEMAQIFKSEIKVVSVVEMHDEFVLNSLRRQMDQVCEVLAENNIPHTAEFLEKDGTIAHSVLEYCYTQGVDMLIIMTQQELKITEFFVGSSAQEIINNARIPVMSITPKDVEIHSGGILGT
ncbi:MAG: universal stress protein [Flavobacteriales bacterium]|nr:universal stress protein [Flavobacteriales bacterium]MCX7651051.1 universal stress protein [Flavobacteriales bacterium]MDW8433004.1 universal stress protein [Flavobacteriales bacterium]